MLHAVWCSVGEEGCAGRSGPQSRKRTRAGDGRRAGGHASIRRRLNVGTAWNKLLHCALCIIVQFNSSDAWRRGKGGNFREVPAGAT